MLLVLEESKPAEQEPDYDNWKCRNTHYELKLIFIFKHTLKGFNLLSSLAEHSDFSQGPAIIHHRA